MGEESPHLLKGAGRDAEGLDTVAEFPRLWPLEWIDLKHICLSLLNFVLSPCGLKRLQGSLG